MYMFLEYKPHVTYTSNYNYVLINVDVSRFISPWQHTGIQLVSIQTYICSSQV
jgi:hypothetical protein